MVNWNYFDKFDDVIFKYMPPRGEGETVASQIVTAINKLIYKWYNDGDVYDNTSNTLGWCNDLSSYANWLERYADGCEEHLPRVYYATGEIYEDILKSLADMCLNEDYLSDYLLPKVGTIYKCDGDYKFEEVCG